jgi:hypothetical protein
MEATADDLNALNEFLNKAKSIDFKSSVELLDKNINSFNKQLKEQFKGLEKKDQQEKDLAKKQKEFDDKHEKRQKEFEELDEKNYKQKIDRAKKEKENLDKLKSSTVDQIIPSNVKNAVQQPQDSGVDSGLLKGLGNLLKTIPNTIIEGIKNRKSKSDEQENIGEDVLKVSFHPDGIKILKTLLDPIYKALNANTDILDKLLKKGEETRGGMLGWLALLFAAAGIFQRIANLISGIAKIVSDAYEFSKTKLLKFLDDIKAFPDELKKLLKLDEISDWFKLKWKSFVDAAKDIIKYDELVDSLQLQRAKYLKKLDEVFDFGKILNSLSDFKAGFNLKWEKYVKEPFLKGLDFLSDVFKGVSGFIDNLKSIVGPTSIFKTVLNGIIDGFNALKTPIMTILNVAIKPLTTALMAVIKPFMPLIKALSWVLMILDPLIAAGKTLFEVWNNENLSFIQKTITVLISAFGGLGDSIASLVGIVSEGATGIWNFITGKGWKTENAVGNFARGLTNDYSFGGMGANMGKTSAQFMEDYNKGKLGDSVGFDKVKGMFGAKTGAAALSTPMNDKMQELLKDGVLSDEDMKFLDTKFNQMGQPVEDLIKKSNNDNRYIVDTKRGSVVKPAFDDEITSTKKGGIIDESLTKLQKIMSEVNDNIKLVGQNLANIQPNYINNSTNISNGGSKENKQYLFQPMFDVNNDKRSQWWRHSREYSATY